MVMQMAMELHSVEAAWGHRWLRHWWRHLERWRRLAKAGGQVAESGERKEVPFCRRQWKASEEADEARATAMITSKLYPLAAWLPWPEDEECFTSRVVSVSGAGLLVRYTR